MCCHKEENNVFLDKTTIMQIYFDIAQSPFFETIESSFRDWDYFELQSLYYYSISPTFLLNGESPPQKFSVVSNWNLNFCTIICFY